jgi:hypothetical protein
MSTFAIRFAVDTMYKTTVQPFAGRWIGLSHQEVGASILYSLNVFLSSSSAPTCAMHLSAPFISAFTRIVLVEDSALCVSVE